ncbi:PIN domain-containing protein [Motilibacter peucedani]|uniref:PIN domain-containing protein n=1 Tax=Motilibacter peucedani TaxID=598650 RepID=UPI0022ABC0C1|nr:PIN domain-containing protein [Motilibacter peucedani]
MSDAADRLERELDRWTRPGRLVVPDTNVFLHLPEPWVEVPWKDRVGCRVAEALRLVIPLLVVDELDRAKLGRNETRSRARGVLRLLDQHFPDPSAVALLAGSGELQGSVTVELLLDDLGHVRLPDADSGLVDRAVELQALADRDVTIVTLDIGMALRARAAGVRALRLTE